MKIEIDVEIGVCDNCYFRGIDGAPGSVMVCNHNDVKEGGYIISWDKTFTSRISNNCPLDEKNKKGRV